MNTLKSIVGITGATVCALLLTMVVSAPVHAGQSAVTQAPQLPKLHGTIKDPSGGVMVGVDVAVLQGARVAKAGKTDSDGNFSFDLASGQYALAVTSPDFKTYTQAVRLTSTMPALVITMSLEGITSVVEVKDNVNVPVVDAALSLDAQTLTADQIADLPDDEESLLAYLQALAGGAANAQLIIDGFEGGRMPTRDQIAQIIIEPNSFNANGTGPRITIVSKQAGPTKWQGNASLSYQDAALNARNPGATTRAPLHKSGINTSYNGPVIKGKLGMTFNLSKQQSDDGNYAIRAITPSGPINQAVTSPYTSDSWTVSNNWYFSTKHTMNHSFNYNRNKTLNQGVGGFALQDRASDRKGHNWNFQVSDNKTISSKMINQFGFRISRSGSQTTPRTNAIAINVLDSFYSGGAQNLNVSRGTSMNMNNNLRWTPNTKWNFQFSLTANYQTNFTHSESNFLGTFTFSSLADYLAGRALTFSKSSGNPETTTRQFDGYAALQATRRIKQSMSFSIGAQYGMQTHFTDHNNVSPTMQFQAQVKKRSIISIGARLNYPTVPYPLFYYEAVLRGDGTSRQFNTSISNPTYPDPFAGGDAGTTTGTGSTLQLRDRNLISPYTMNVQMSLSESLPKGWRISPTFNFNRTVHQIRNRNINAPYPGTALDPSLTRAQIDQLRPFFPIVSRINQYESTGNSRSRNINITVQTPTTKTFLKTKTQLQGNFQYGLTWQEDDNSAENPYDVQSDWARNDQRQRFQGTFSVRPAHLGSYSFNVSANTGRAYNITTGKDDNFDQSFSDRPAGVKRNSLRGPGYYTVNLNYSSPNLSFRKKKPAPKAAETPTAPSANPQLDALLQSARAAGIPEASIQQLIATVAAQPGLLTQLGNSIGPVSTSSTTPTLSHPLVTLSVNVRNLLNNTTAQSYSGVITSPFFGRASTFNNGRSISLSLSSRF